MSVDTNRTVRELAVELPSATRVFEKLGIDYCCGGHRPLREACEHSGVPVDSVVASLELAAKSIEQDHANAGKNWSAGSLADLIDQIVNRHHVYVRQESPRIQQLFTKVASKHGGNHPEVLRAQELFGSLAEELSLHLMKEENILFPYIVRMEEAVLQKEPVPPAMFGTVQHPVQMMMTEHDHAGEILREIRKETNNLKAPDDACISYRTLYEAVLAFEADLHQHIHLENNILFPAALQMEVRR